LLSRYVDLLKKGEVVAFPTETVYGLGAEAWNPDAIQKIFDVKERPADNPLIVHISDYRTVNDFAADVSEDAEKLMQQFWPGPLTLILKKKPKVLDIITAGLPTIALRWPKHPLSQELIAQAGPLVAPSANSSGKPSPTKAAHVKNDFGDDFPIIDAGETEIGLESTVLDISEEPYRIYRPGGVSAEEIKKVIGKEILMADSSQKKEDTAAKSPGTKYSHYSPDATIKWLEDTPSEANTLYLLHTNEFDQQVENVIHYHGNYCRMAHELYDRFRQADLEGFSTVAIEPFSEDQKHELVPALINRIEKALSR
jgi:L-threonylcarbamoyladenylate synthase